MLQVYSLVSISIHFRITLELHCPRVERQELTIFTDQPLKEFLFLIFQLRSSLGALEFYECYYADTLNAMKLMNTSDCSVKTFLVSNTGDSNHTFDLSVDIKDHRTPNNNVVSAFQKSALVNSLNLVSFMS